MKLLVKGFAAAAFMAVAVSTFGSTAVAQPAQAAQTQLGPETDDPVKIRLYLQFYDNHATNRTLAYQAAKDYLQKYTKDKDQYIDYLTKWVTIYERDERKRKLPGLINEKNFAEAYSTGAKISATPATWLLQLKTKPTMPTRCAMRDRPSRRSRQGKCRLNGRRSKARTTRLLT
jgi:hypothetical protein